MATCRWFFTAFVMHFAMTIAVTSDTPAGPGTNRTLSYPKTWLADLFYNTLRDFAMPGDVGSSACRNQAQMYRKHLKNGSHWAVQMSDSWSRYPTGVLVSTSHQMGVYDECVTVHQPVRGMYCLPNVLLKSTTEDDYTAGKPDEPVMNENAWREIIGFVNNDFAPHKNNVKFGICIPDSCTAQDLEMSLQKEFDMQFLPHRVKAEVRVESILCSTDQDMYPLDTGFYFTSILFEMILLTCGLSTVYHLIVLIQSNNKENTCIMPESLRYFSIIHNGKELFKYDKNNNLNLFNGIQVTFMLIVIFAHKLFSLLSGPMVYGKWMEMMYSEEPKLTLTILNIVDPFFYVMGLLMYITKKSQFQKPGSNWLQVLMVIVHKYLKFLPSYVMIMLLTAFVIPHMGDGPIWAAMQWPEADKCKSYWWANILGVSNFIESNHQCLIVSWYLSCFLQFLVIGNILIYVYAKNRKIGIYLVVILFIVSVITRFAMTYYHRAYGIVRMLYSFLINFENSFEFSNFYRPFYTRGIPFLAGILGGIIAEEMKIQKIKFSPFVVYFGSLVVYALCFRIQWYTAVSYQLHRPYDVQEQSIFSVVTHLTWTTMLFWTTLCHLTSGYGPVEKIFNNPLMVILNRLTYSVYLINFTIIYMTDGKQRTAIYPTAELLIDQWISIVFKSYLVGTLLYLTIEAPTDLLLKKLFDGRRVDDRDSKPKNTTNVENTLEEEHQI